ncbi:MAG: imidazolonepropionase [Candidatus Aminicenantes bacterium]|nr:imidazolonepropionase [Candidatus Aminicenantes bacterium]NIM78008.1 imidazolonepropionase [Candidatus Aminicenantes bacterium]NIN17330.1 imidazolonepropionase [Candidatus Aminicenantes bacterium]NIN41222.1 imidazolonepropionase [Candidatus Aminicenantes bacterium]NIN83996.1 imidazolonepropionase [Candidatus Aminicenantes bacterium]
MEIDVLIKNIKELVNPANDNMVRGNDLNTIRVSHNVWLGAVGETIAFIGYEKDFSKNCTLSKDAMVMDGSDFVVFPGFVDPHTHLPFAHTRQDEFRLKLQGVSYQEIAAKGGGIKGTVRKTREIETNDLIAQCETRLDSMLTAGTTTIEAKSGYGLDMETEIKQLEVLQALKAIHPLKIVPTFMGAHEIPEEYKGRNKEFLDYLIENVVPVVKERELAEFVDIFCEKGVFSYEDAEYYFDKIEPYGFKIKLHADEFTSNNAALLAVKKNAVSAEHLIAMTDEEIEAISASNTACVFLPGVSFFLKLGKYAPARNVIEKNGIVALGTDFNPGSSMVSSQLFCFHLGIFNMGLTIEEAINTITINAAYAIDRHDVVGSIAVGKKMDVLLMDIPDYSYLAYHLGINPVHTVLKSGEVVVKNRQSVYE